MLRGLPIRFRLTIASAVLMAVVIGLLGLFLYLRLEADLEAALDDRLRDQASVVAGVVAGPGSLDNLLLGDPGDAFVQVLDAGGSIVATTPGLRDNLLPPDAIAGLAGERSFEVVVETAEEPVPARLLATSRAAGGAIVVGASIEDQQEALARLLGLLAIGGPIAIALASGVGWLVAGAALRPVERLRIEAEAVSASEPGRRLEVPATRDELARLAVSLNHMLDRLEGATERERRFVANASHELRTPLANLKAELDLALRRARSPVELESTIRSAAEETDRLTLLAEDLLILARAGGAAGLPLRREPVDATQLLRDTAASFAFRAAVDRVELRVQTTEAIELTVDPTRIRQALGNLIDNAIRHTPAGGHVEVAAVPDGTSVEMTVADSGAGFGAGGPGRTGLGLSIVRAIAEAHGGTVVLGAAPAGGASVTIRLPR